MCWGRWGRWAVPTMESSLLMATALCWASMWGISFWITWSVMPWGNWWHSSMILQEERSSFKSHVLLHSKPNPNSTGVKMEENDKRNSGEKYPSIASWGIPARTPCAPFPFPRPEKLGTAESVLTQPPLPPKHLPARNSLCPQQPSPSAPISW